MTISGPNEGVAALCLDRAEKRNSLSIAVRNEMSDALDDLAADEAVRAVVVCTTGTVFCAGFDLSEFSDPALQEHVAASSERWHDRIRSFPLPLIASIQGAALAGGFDLAMMCDLRVASEAASFARPEMTWAPPMYSVLYDIVGGAKARELSMAPRSLDAQEALALGLVTEVVDANKLKASTFGLAQAVATAPRSVLAQTKRTATEIARSGASGFRW